MNTRRVKELQLKCIFFGAYLEIEPRVGAAQQPELPDWFYRTGTGKELVLEGLRGPEKEDRRAAGLDLMRLQFGCRSECRSCEN